MNTSNSLGRPASGSAITYPSAGSSPKVHSRSAAYHMSQSESPRSPRRAWEDPSTPSAARLSSVAHSNLASVHPAPRSSVSTVTTSVLSECSTNAARSSVTNASPLRYSVSTTAPSPHASDISPRTSIVEQTNPLTATSEKPLAAKVKVFEIFVLRHLITEYAPNYSALLSVNRAFKTYFSASLIEFTIYQKFLKPLGLEKEKPHFQNNRLNYQIISNDLSIYVQMMVNAYKARVPYFKHKDYTPYKVLQTTPLGIFSTISREAYHFCTDWSETLLTEQQKEYLSKIPDLRTNVNNLPWEMIALKIVGYFLSIPPQQVRAIIYEPGILEKHLEQDPAYLNRLFKYLSDQIYYTPREAKNCLQGFYDLIDALLGNHMNKLSYEVLHYALLVLIDIYLFTPDKKLDRNRDHLTHINLILAQISKIEKLEVSACNPVNLTKRPDLTQQLCTLLSQEQYNAKLAELKEINLASYYMLEMHGKTWRADVTEIVKKYFPIPTQKKRFCVIS